MLQAIIVIIKISSKVSLADAAILVIDASACAFESGYSSAGKTLGHVILAQVMTVRYIILVVYKMDHYSV